MSEKNYFLSKDKSVCSGCRACQQACPCNAIQMRADDEGFLYPHIIEEKCVKCGKCENICPVHSPVSKSSIDEIYAVQSKDAESLSNSSSGGVFAVLADVFIKNQGVVFGCVLENNSATIISTTKQEKINQMQGSKYVSSDTGNTYQEAKQLLDSGVSVFYTGTPCQIAGLRAFLGKDYENLITMDFLCHGVPSAEIFKENIKYIEQKYKGELSEYKFRDKSLKGWGHVTSFCVKGKKHYQPGKLNAYFCGFINNYLNRYICYSCPFRGQERMSDFTVGDFWGYDTEKVNTQKGVSFIAINLDKGKKMFEEKLKDSFFVESTTVATVSKMNSSILSGKESEIPNERKSIYKYVKDNGYQKTVKKFLIPKNYVVLRISTMLPDGVKKRIVKLIGRMK